MESHFQEVLAALQQSAEEGGRGDGAALRSRLQRLYRRIVPDADSGRSSLGGKKRKSSKKRAGAEPIGGPAAQSEKNQ